MFYVKYEGTFAFIKPWTAVRDSEIYSQQFLTQSIIEGIEKKLFPELLNEDYDLPKKILRYRLNYLAIDLQQEVIWSKGLLDDKSLRRNKSILKRGVLINPKLYLLFSDEADAQIAFTQSICLVRNEDLMFPMEIKETNYEDFEQIPGFELIFSDNKNGFLVGVNRFSNNEMYGILKIYGNPMSNEND